MEQSKSPLSKKSLKRSRSPESDKTPVITKVKQPNRVLMNYDSDSNIDDEFSQIAKAASTLISKDDDASSASSATESKRQKV